MKIKDNFWFGLSLSVILFFVLYSIINLFTDFSYFSQNRDSLWTYMLSLIPNLLIARFMLVKWNLESVGKGMIFTTLIGVVFVMYMVLK